MMKIVSWNVNGLKAVLKNRRVCLRDFLDSFSADVICLQEVKSSRSLLDHSIAVCEGYTAYFALSRTKQGYSGVVTFCKSTCTPSAAEEGITGCRASEDGVACPVLLPLMSAEELQALDSEGRAVLTHHRCVGGNTIAVLNVYCPRVGEENPERMSFKINFFTVLRERCVALQRSGREVVVVGDFNTTLEVIDSASLSEMKTFPPQAESKKLLKEFVSCSFDKATPPPLLVDTFRYLHPNQTGAYSCWCTKTESRKLNYGQRIDFILVTSALLPLVREGHVLQEEYGSDHCPVTAVIDVTLVAAPTPPDLCSANYSEFTGTQSKLSSFFQSSGNPVSDTADGTVATGKRVACDAPAEKSSKKPKYSSTQNSITSFMKLAPSVQKTSSLPQVFPSLPSSNSLSTKWQSLFSAPPKTPDCTGHSEPSVLRIVKKPGPNNGRKFYVCARPEGAKNDPASRCNFFKWASKK